MTNNMTGTVRRFNSEGRYGFIQMDGMREDCFFHMDRQVKVEGNHLEPVLTSEAENIEPSDNGHYSTKVVVELERGPKGMRAVRWGIMPRRDWRAEAEKWRLLDRYTGGKAYIYAHNRKECVEGVITAVELRGHTLKLILKDRESWQGNRFNVRNLNPQPTTQQFDLHATDDLKLPYGRFGIKFFEPYGQEIIFYPPEI